MEGSSSRYEPKPIRSAELTDALINLGQQKLRNGYRRLHAALGRAGIADGEPLNVNRAYRIYLEEALNALSRDR